MDWKSHVLFGLLLYSMAVLMAKAFQFAIGLDTIFGGAIVTIIYSLLPDIDMEKSRIHKAVSLSLLIAAILGFVAFAYYKSQVFLAMFLALVAIAVAAKFLKHRGFTHTLRFGLLCSVPFLIVHPSLFFAALIGFASHLIADLHFKL